MQSIVTAHGGKIVVISQPKGGTEFRLRLPLSEDSPALELHVDTADLLAPSGIRRVLVVDDELAIVEVLREMLEE